MTNLIIIGVVVVFLVVVLLMSYVKAPPSIAYIISGISPKPRILIGKGGLRVPFFERLDKVYLGQITVDIKTETSVPTNDFINVDVDAVAKVRVTPTPDGTRLASKNFLNMNPGQIADQLQDSLQGNMREIIGTLDLKTLNVDRDGFSDQVMHKASPDMAKLGIEIISCNIQNVTDRAVAIVEDAELIYGRSIQDLEMEIKRFKRDRENLLDLSPDNAQSLKLASDFDAQAFVMKDQELAMKIRNKNIQLNLAKQAYNELFGSKYNVEEIV